MLSKITNLPPHAQQMSNSPHLPPLLISDSVSLNHSLHPPPELELTLLMENLEFFILQIQLPQIIPQHTPKLEQ